MKHGLSQAKLAKFAKISLNTIGNVEAGRGKPMKGTFLKIKQAIKAVADTPAREMKRKAAPKAKPTRKVAKRKGRGRARKTTDTGPIKLSNVDLELFSRVLNMSEGEKIALLKKMM